MTSSTNPIFLNSVSELRKWFMKNHNKTNEVWLGLQKGRGSDLTQRDTVDMALCFGWAISITKGIDALTYTIKYVKRRPGSRWSFLNTKRFQELKKLGLVHKSGLAAFENRDKSKDEKKNPQFSSKQLKLFKSNTKAWAFFESQTNSYKKYMIHWVTEAKREETQLRRLQMLIEDSGNESKLRRVVEAQNKLKKSYEPGKTPIEEARNIGPICGAELRSIGVSTVEKLIDMGWDEVFRKLCEMYPHRMNLNMVVGLVAAVENQDWRKLNPNLKAEAKALLREIKNEVQLIS